MNRYKKLVGNSVIFAVGNFGSKLMQFIMVPIYSYTLNSVEFGKVDFLTTLVSLVAPIICFDMFDAVFRFALDKNEDSETVLSTGLIFTCAMSGIAMLIALFLDSFIDKYPVYLTVWLLIFTMLYSLLSNYARAIGYVRKFTVAGILNTLIMGILNIIFLIVFNKGIKGYLISMVLALAFSSFYICYSTNMYKNIHLKMWKFSKFKEMCKYSLPLIPNNLAWWFNSASDRFFIMFFLGAKANGIYAMANKIPNMLNMLTSIFFQSWQMSAVEEYSAKDSKKFISNVFEFFISLLFFFALALISVIRPTFEIALNSQYYSGWKLTPFVLLTVIYSSLSGFLGTMYTATKRTLPVLYTTIIGAIINVIFSVLLISRIGVYGAALANNVSFLAVSGIRFFDIIKDDKISINLKKFIILHLLFLINSLSLFFVRSDFILFLIGIFLLVLQILFDSNIKFLFKNIFTKFFMK